MISARLLKKTAPSAIALVIGLSSAVAAAPVSGFQRGPANVHLRPATTGTLNVLHSFAGTDGSAPVGNLDLALGYSNGTITRSLYGATEGGGAQSSGTIYAFNLGSNAFSSLYAFSGGNDGGIPAEGLANNDTNYFIAGQAQIGVTVAGGAYGFGTVFVAAANGAVKTIYSFTGGNDGANPAGRLTLFTDGNYYGTTSGGGADGAGTVYRITPAGAFSTIYTFTGGNDGGSPEAGLALNVSIGGKSRLSPAGERAASMSKSAVAPYLYGTTATGGRYASGTIFRISPSGQLKTLHVFTGLNDGGAPAAKLTTDFVGNLYGTTTVGGAGGNGVVFAVAGGSKYGVIHDFGNGAGGASPQAQLALGLTGNLYGTTTTGGASGIYGTVFEVNPQGTYADIHDFQSTDGANPQGALVDGGDGNLYGTTVNGGALGDGVLFSISE